MSTAVTVEADGGSRGNPGPAGYGALVRDTATGELLAERSEFLGVVTNNVAEYSGLVAGLRAAAELGATTVAVRMDSKLVVEQMSGRWQIKHPDLRPLAREANELRRGFQSVTFEWIPRERNKHADRLANEAMDDGTGRTRARIPRVESSPPKPQQISSDVAERIRGRDVYLIEADSALLGQVAQAMATLVPAKDVVLAGVERSGVPLAVLLGQLTGRSVRFVHEEAVEGGSVDGRDVVVVAGVISTGATALTTVDALRAAGAVVDTVICMVDRQQGSAAALTGKGVEVRALIIDR